MWIDDRYSFVDQRYGRIAALRPTLSGAARTEEILSALAARQVVMSLARDPGARHHMVALSLGLGVEVNVAALARTPTAKLAMRLLRAVDQGRLIFSTGQVAAAPDVPSAVASLIETLMPHAERLTVDGQSYRLAPLLGRGRLSVDEIVVPRGEAHAVLLRLRDRYGRSPAIEEAWDQAVVRLRDGTEPDKKDAEAVVLVRLVIRQTVSPPSAAAVTPSSLVEPQASVAPEESEEAPEFSCADEQAEAMAAAARDGVPFCLECACGEHASESEPVSSPDAESQAAQS